MSAREIKAGRAFVEVSIRDKLTQGLRSAWGKLKAFAGMVRTAFLAVAGVAASLTAAITAVAAPIVMLSKHFADVGGKLDDVSKRTGVAVETLSAMKYAAEQTGTSMEDVERAMRGMARNGIPVEKFDELAAAITAIDDPTERAAAALKIFGRAGTQLLPMLSEWNELKDRAARLGLVVTKEEAESAADLGDRFDTLGSVWDRLKVKAGASFAPLMSRALGALTDMIVHLARAMDVVSQSMLLISVGMDNLAKKANMFIGNFTNGVADMLKQAEALTGLKLGSGVVRAGGAIAGVGAESLLKGGAASALPPGMEQQYNRLVEAVRGGSFGTFSSPGASLAGRAGQAIKPDDGVNKKILAVLEKIGVKLDTLEDINEGIEEFGVFEN